MFKEKERDQYREREIHKVKKERKKERERERDVCSGLFKSAAQIQVKCCCAVSLLRCSNQNFSFSECGGQSNQKFSSHFIGEGSRSKLPDFLGASFPLLSYLTFSSKNWTRAAPNSWDACPELFWEVSLVGLTSCVTFQVLSYLAKSLHSRGWECWLVS